MNITCPKCNLVPGMGAKVLMLETSPGTFRCPYCKHEEHHGQYWRTLTPNQRSAFTAPSGPGRAVSKPRALASPYGAGPVITGIDPGIPGDPDPGLTQKVLDAIHQQVLQGMYSTFIYGNGIVDRGHNRPPLKREMVVGEIIGYRCWRFNGTLNSVFQNDTWYPDETMVGRGLEDWSNRGVHAWKEQSERYQDYVIENISTRSIVCGTVYLWGDVVEHQHGYRAEFAKIRSLDWVYFRDPQCGKEQKLLDGLRKMYHV